MWYEGGELRPPLVRLTNSTSPFRSWRAEPRERFRIGPGNKAEGAPKRRTPTPGERARRQPLIDVVSVLASKTHMKGGITDNGEESQGREEEGRQETVS